MSVVYLFHPNFCFSRLYTAASTQEDVFANEVEPLATRALQGLNATAFTYGVTGSGKTHSMMGREQVCPCSVIFTCHGLSISKNTN
jgi:hypothetical protein